MTTLRTPPVAVPVLAPGPFATVPNAVTLVRTVLAVAVGAVGVAHDDLRLLGLAYAVYWLGDVLDGWTARRLGQETRAGATLDVVSDRACTSLLCVGLIAHLAPTEPAIVPVGAVFLLSFMVLDTMLSLAFLCWPILGPNDFHRVDQRVWRLNWSPVAKALNTAGVVVAVVAGLPWIALGVALAVVVVKLWSARRIVGLLGAGSP